jgi:hypothetical protein
MRSWCSAVRTPGQAGLGRPRHPGGTGPAAADRAARLPAGHAGHVAGVAPSADHAQVDVPEPTRPTADQPGDLRWTKPRSSRAATVTPLRAARFRCQRKIVARVIREDLRPAPPGRSRSLHVHARPACRRALALPREPRPQDLHHLCHQNLPESHPCRFSRTGTNREITARWSINWQTRWSH